MNKENKILRIVIPVLAVVVITESLILVGRLTKKSIVETSQEKTEASKPTEVEVIEEPTFELVSMASKTALKVGEKTTVTVYASSKGDYFLDAINLYLKADTKNLTLSNLTFDPKMPKPVFSKISTKQDLVVVSYMISEPSGLKVIKNNSMVLAKFDVIANKEGEYIFDVSTSKDSKESATMLVESATSKVLPYSSNKLIINVVNK